LRSNIEQEKHKCPILYEFLNKNNFKLKNIYVVYQPVFQYMYIKNNNLLTKSYCVEYHETDSELKKFMMFSEKVFIFPEEDIYADNAVEYKKHLRICFSNNESYVLMKSRQAKIERLINDNTKNK